MDILKELNAMLSEVGRLPGIPKSLPLVLRMAAVEIQKGRVTMAAAAETIAEVADRINDACNDGGEIRGSETVDPLMRVHGELTTLTG